MANTMARSGLATSTAAAVGASKSKTPCYFFAQGYCAKNDQCPFVHGLPAASSTAEAAAYQISVGVDGKALHASHASGGPLIVPKQSGLSPQEVRPVTIGRPETLNKTHINTSMAPGPKQGMPYCSERVASFERVTHCNFSNGSRHSKITKKMLENQDNFQGLLEAGKLKMQYGYQTEALLEVGPTGGGSCQSLEGDKGEYSSPSDSREIPNRLITSWGWNGQEADDISGECKGLREELEHDRGAFLAGRSKINSSVNSSRGNGGHPDLATQCHRAEKLRDFHLKRGNQEQGDAVRKVTMEVDAGRVKRAQFNKLQCVEASEQGFGKEQSRSFLVKEGTTHQPKAHNVEAAATPKKGAQSSSTLRTNRLISGPVKEPLLFAGPKSLAQIKAERRAGGESGSKAIGRLDSSSIVPEASLKHSDRILAVPAESWNASATNEKALSSFVSTTRQDDGFKHGTVVAEEFEGPKSFSTLLKRKRELDSVKEIMVGATEAQVGELKSFKEMEDGEFCSDDDSSNVDDIDAVVSSQEDVVGKSTCTKDVTQGLQRSSGEAVEFESESSDEVSKADLEMEEIAYGGGDYEIDEDDDEDEEDFAKKLGRMFGLSYE